MKIIKKGTIDADIVESNPIVFKGRLYIFQYIRSATATRPAQYSNKIGKSYFRFLDVEADTYTSPFGIGLHMGNAFVWENKVYVTAVEDWGKSHFYITSSSDLENWSEPEVILENPAWAGYNTSMCRVNDYFLLAFELGKPEDIVQVPFTMFFAKSYDLKNFTIIDGAVFGQEIYTGAPLLRYFDDYYYFCYLDGSYEDGFVTKIVRSKDLKNWQWGKKTVLEFEENDRLLAASVKSDAPWLDKAATAVNINASDLDMVEFNGNLEMVYSWGNQSGTEFLARAIVYDVTEKEFCKSFFE